jgi:hypothetical protein
LLKERLELLSANHQRVLPKVPSSVSGDDVLPEPIVDISHHSSLRVQTLALDALESLAHMKMTFG